MKLYGKELDDELARREKSRQDRIAQRVTLREAAKKYGISCTEILAYEAGHDVCPHEEWEDNAGGFPIPKILFKQCKKCGKIDSDSTEKVDESNFNRVYEIYRRLYPKKENEDAAEK